LSAKGLQLKLSLLCCPQPLRFALVRNFAGWDGFDGWARKAMFKILGEDKVMVEKLTPERLEAEFSLGPDAPQVRRWHIAALGFSSASGPFLYASYQLLFPLDSCTAR